MKQFILILIIGIVSCSSVSEKVLVRMNDMSKRPAWATLLKTIFAKDGRIYSVGTSEAKADSRISALIRIADNNARFEIARTITNDMSFIFQNLEEGIDNSGQLSRFYGNEMSKLISHGIRQEKRYWEKVQSFDSFGEKIYKLRVYSLISIRESSLKKALVAAIKKDKKITPEVLSQINNHLKNQIQSFQKEGQGANL